MALAAERSFVMAVKEAKDIIAGPVVVPVSHGKMAGFQQQKVDFMDSIMKKVWTNWGLIV